MSVIGPGRGPNKISSRLKSHVAIQNVNILIIIIKITDMSSSGKAMVSPVNNLITVVIGEKLAE